MSARFERKYRVSDREAAFLRACWEPHLQRAPFTDASASYPVLSQYFDTPDLRFYRQKHAGVGLRKKVRLRTYGYRFEAGAAAFLEIKHRRDESVWKTRVRVAFRREHLQPDHWPADAAGALAPLRALADVHHLRPTAQVLYVRQAFQAVVEEELRVTFDALLVGLHPGEEASRGALQEGSRALLPETQVVVELKGRGLLPGWAREGIRWVELRQEPVPKYVLAMDRLNLVRLGMGVYA